jgi:hypothetical protein
MLRSARRFILLSACSALGFAGMASAAPFDHVLVISIDGMHESDLFDPAVNQYLPNITNFANSSIQYTNVHSATPSDSFPTTLAMFTGASPATTGVYYDTTYNRALYAPGSTLDSAPGTPIIWDGSINKQSNLIEGAPFGHSDATSIDVNKLPLALVNGQLQPVYPHDYLQVHTVFEVAHNAGLQTAWIDKHPSYEILNGPSGTGLSDFYAPDVDAKASLTGGVLVDNASGNKISKTLALSKAYDDIRLTALLNQMQGKTSSGAAAPSVPAIFGMNFIAANTSHKDTGIGSGISIDSSGHEFVGLNTQDALRHVDDSFGQVLSGLQQNGLAQNTLVILTAKNGDNPKIGKAVNQPSSWLLNPLAGAGIEVAQATQDDVALIWLKDQSKTNLAASILSGVDPSGTLIQSVLSGSTLTTAGFADPLHDNRSPDIVVALQPGVVITDSSKRAEHGGFSEDETHIPLVLGGAIQPGLAGSFVSDELLQTQLAPTILEALGLDATGLDGAVAERTTALPGSGIPVPEPSCGLLAGAGVLAASLRRRRR